RLGRSQVSASYPSYAAVVRSDLFEMPENQRRNARFLPTYATLVGAPALALVVILRVGDKLVSNGPTKVPVVAVGPAQVSSGGALPDVPLLLVQIIVILVAARLVGAVVRRFGQPQVVGEMLAGIARGASLPGGQGA